MWGGMNFTVTPFGVQKRGYHGLASFSTIDIQPNKFFPNPNLADFKRNIHGKTNITDIRNVNEEVIANNTANSSSSIIDNIRKIKPDIIMKSETVGKNCRKPKRKQHSSKKTTDFGDLNDDNMEVEQEISMDDVGVVVSPQPLILRDFLQRCERMEVAEVHSPKTGAIDVVAPVLRESVCFSITPPKSCKGFASRERCDSDDSFVVFESGSEDELNFSDVSDESDSESDFDSSGSVVPNKRVRFADEEDLCEVHPMVQWAYAYQAARKGPWETFARDRERFKKRIQNSETILCPIFERNHRAKIYENRFGAKE